METLKNYLDNMFAGLPKTVRVSDLKSNILSNMEEKYNELKRQGKSENEAIGIVISEFGNIDELINELGLRREDNAPGKPAVTKEEVEAYQTVKKTMGIQVAIGVFLCILAPAVLILLNNLIENDVIFKSYRGESGLPGVIALLIMVTVAVAVFIYSGMNFERYKYMEEGVQLPGSIETELKQRYDRFIPTFYLCLIMGVCLIILSPISIFVSNMISDEAAEYGVVVLLVIVAFSVSLFIYPGMVKESYEKLLQLGDYTPRKTAKSKKDDKVIGAVASIIWPLATVVFLFCGLVYGLWYICWIVFPITGILFGMFCAAYSILTEKNDAQ